MRVVYSPRYHLDFGAHVFPTVKYRRVAERLARAGLIAGEAIAPEPAGWDDLALVHTSSYLDAVRHGTLSPEDLARLEIPGTPAIVEGFRLMTGGTLDRRPPGPRRTRPRRRAHRRRLPPRVRRPRRGLLPVQRRGGGHPPDVCASGAPAGPPSSTSTSTTATAPPPSSPATGRVFTLSVHQQANYPEVKPPGSLDIGLPDGTGDAAYLAALEPALARMLEHLPDLVVYLAGADPYADDQLGGLALTLDGLRRRDRLVFAAARAAGVPIVVLLAGGYARRVDDTVAIHVATIEEAARSA